METLFLTRRQYDYLVETRPNWMALRWATYTRQWSLGGVFVSGDAHDIENLQYQLPTNEVTRWTNT
jgi:hypothetical protein